MTVIFNGGAGTCALSQNDLLKARETLGRAVALDSTDLQSLWQLSIADIESTPVDANGFWYCAKMDALLAFIRESQKTVTGEVTLQLYKGNLVVAGRKSPLSLYDEAAASMEAVSSSARWTL